jgi:hypothetical protein
MWMQSITTYTEFKQAVVEPDFRDFMSDQSNLRKGVALSGLAFPPRRLGVCGAQADYRLQVQIC